MFEEYEQTLAELRSMLEADGYLLELHPPSDADGVLMLRVTAGAEACEECLVPIGLFQEIVAQHLGRSGFRGAFVVVYPNGESGGSAAATTNGYSEKN
jgi:hypothetical protein